MPTGYVLLKRYNKSTVLTIAVHSLLKLLARIMEIIRTKVLCVFSCSYHTLDNFEERDYVYSHLRLTIENSFPQIFQRFENLRWMADLLIGIHNWTFTIPKHRKLSSGEPAFTDLLHFNPTI